MLKKHARFFRRLMISFDLCVVFICFIGAYWIKSDFGRLFPFDYYLWTLPLFLLIWGSLLYFFGMYFSFRLKRISEILLIISKSAVLGVILFGGFAYLSKTVYVSRFFILMVFGFTAGLLIIEKIFLMRMFRCLRKEGFNFRNLVVVGTGPRAQYFAEQINQHKEFGLKIVGFIDEDPSKVGEDIKGHKVFGTLLSLPTILKTKAVDHVFFIVPRSWLGIIEESVSYCETMGVSVSIAVDLFKLKFATGKETNLLGLPFLMFETTSDKIDQLMIKRVIDISVSLIALIILAPLFSVVAVVIKLTSDGPVFFCQERCTLNGRKFILYKFRTMGADAEHKLNDLLKYNEMEGPAFKMENDPRVTSVGRFLRKTSIDELPQLWNVLTGDMSLVGPRPPISSEVEKYDCWQRRRLSMRPGLTCTWQISGRNKITDFNQWSKMDLQYIDQWSLWKDIEILVKTVPVVLLSKGAK